MLECRPPLEAELAVATLITGGTLITMNPTREILRGDVLVDEGRIVAVGRIEPDLFRRRGHFEAIDAAGGIVLPGFVQTHLHLCQTLFRGSAEDLVLLDWLKTRIWPFEAAHTESSIRASTRLGISELLLGGTTAALDMGTVRHTDAIFREASALGFRLVGGKAIMDAEDPSVPPGLRESTDDALAESLGLCDRWHGAEDGRLRYAFAPRFALSCTERVLRDVAECARKRGVLVHTHASENRDEIAEVRRRTGLDNIAYMNAVGLTGPHCCLAHCVWATDDEMDLMARTGTRVLHCPSSNLKLGSGVARVPEMLSRGIEVSLGADGAPCNNNLDMFTEMRLAALLQKPRAGVASLPAATVLEMATLGGARTLGLEAEIGSIEPGKRADLVVVDIDAPHASPGEDLAERIVYATRASDVRTVLVGGVTVVQNRRLLVADPDEVVAQATSELEALRRRV
ncbi:MAG: 5'-deoxyadenosine deaminase [Planctomycetes bacterium]|nr:5'-deoxyadenosine deaminase [Planctomycetota bacterium]